RIDRFRLVDDFHRPFPVPRRRTHGDGLGDETAGDPVDTPLQGRIVVDLALLFERLDHLHVGERRLADGFLLGYEHQLPPSGRAGGAGGESEEQDDDGTDSFPFTEHDGFPWQYYGQPGSTPGPLPGSLPRPSMASRPPRRPERVVIDSCPDAGS